MCTRSIRSTYILYNWNPGPATECYHLMCSIQSIPFSCLRDYPFRAGARTPPLGSRYTRAAHFFCHRSREADFARGSFGVKRLEKLVTLIAFPVRSSFAAVSNYPLASVRLSACLRAISSPVFLVTARKSDVSVESTKTTAVYAGSDVFRAATTSRVTSNTPCSVSAFSTCSRR